MTADEPASSLPWDEIEHTADWALRVHGTDLRALFENAARGMVSLIGGVADPEQAAVHKTFTLQAPDHETLLVDWLSELLYLIEDQNLVFTEIAIHRLEGLALEARVRGRSGGSFQKHIKAATYHNLSIQQTAEGYETTIVFDV
jgi:SHS2 domain-containing protein